MGGLSGERVGVHFQSLLSSFRSIALDSILFSQDTRASIRAEGQKQQQKLKKAQTTTTKKGERGLCAAAGGAAIRRGGLGVRWAGWACAGGAAATPGYAAGVAEAAKRVKHAKDYPRPPPTRCPDPQTSTAPPEALSPLPPAPQSRSLVLAVPARRPPADTEALVVEEIVRAAVENDGNSLEYASFLLRHDFNIVVAADLQNRASYQFAYP